MFREKIKTGPKFTEFIDKKSEENPCGIFSPPITDSEAMTFLTNYLLGEDWYTPNPIGHDQVNTEIVHKILFIHSPAYRKEYREWQKRIN